MRKKKIIYDKEKEGNVKIKYKIINTRRGKFPVATVFCIILIAVCLIGLIHSYAVLNEKNMEINKLRELIALEKEKMGDWNIGPDPILTENPSHENILISIAEKIFYKSK